MEELSFPTVVAQLQEQLMEALIQDTMQ